MSVRVRPLGPEERCGAWKLDGKSIQEPTNGRGRERSYTFDNVFDQASTTSAVYEHTTKELVLKVVDGFNCTVFAYGQTSSGKTHTMRGTQEEPGVITLAVQDIFGTIASQSGRQFCLRVSYMEVRRRRHAPSRSQRAPRAAASGCAPCDGAVC